MPDFTVIVGIYRAVALWWLWYRAIAFFQSLEAAVTEVAFPTRWRDWPMLHHRVYNAHERAANLRVDRQRSQWVPQLDSLHLREAVDPNSMLDRCSSYERPVFIEILEEPIIAVPHFFYLSEVFKTSCSISHQKYKRWGGGGNIVGECLCVRVCVCMCGVTFVVHEGPTTLM